MEELGPIIVGIASLIGGVWLLIHTLGQIKRAKNAAINWPKALGKVIRSKKRMSNFGSAQSRNPKANTYALDIEYEYCVDGENYISNKPLFFALYVFDDIEAFLAKYPQGQEISVYYDPANHQSAVIETTLYGKSGKHEMGFAVMLILLSALLFAIRYPLILQWAT